MSEVPINVVIPMGGLGSRFFNDGYRFPKPLLNITGRPVLLWLLDNLALKEGIDTLWIALPAEIEDSFMLSLRVKKEYPKLDVRCITLKFQTRGAAETLFAVVQSMDEEHLGRRTISLDCDTIYFTDILSTFRSLPSNTHASCYFHDNEGVPIFSYLKLDDEDRVLDVREKEAISQNANTGAYGFGSARRLKEVAQAMVDSAVGAKGEYYTSGLLKILIDCGEDVRGIYVDSMACVGTPKQMQAFLATLLAPPRRNRESGELSAEPSGIDLLAKHRKRRFCFDLDGTLVTFPTISGDYSSVMPIWSNIELVRQLHRAGHTIIIQTARRMKTHGGNVAAVLADIGRVTFDSLEKFGVPYDEIIFGKPWADVYVDDNAVHAQLDTHREIGWAKPDEGGEEVPKGFVPARAFHSLVVTNDEVTKTGPHSTMDGEIFFYQNIPSSLADLFPSLRGVQEVVGHEDRISLSISRIQDCTSLSHMLLNRCVTKTTVCRVLEALNRIHTFESDSTRVPEDKYVYLNYSKKLHQRAKRFKEVGQPDAQPVVDDCLFRLDKFEKERRAVPVAVIHGDPVFSNIVVCRDSTIKFFDMRGALGDVLCIGGDRLYDFAKVFQSLLGYDMWILDQDVDAISATYLAGLQQCFWAWIADNLSKVHAEDIKIITASLLLSAAPMHAKARHSSQFVKVAAQLLGRTVGK